MKDFKVSAVVSLICLALAAYWGFATGTGWAAAVTIAAVLGVMEVSLSFDNAVVNASILKTMDEKWRRIFLTVGIVIAVFGMRVLFPLVIVAVATGMGMLEVSQLALTRPVEYAQHLQEKHIVIAAFGGCFLLLVFLGFIFDPKKKLHWLGAIEARLARMGKLDAIGVVIALLCLFAIQMWMPLSEAERLSVMVAGVAGVILHVLVSSLDAIFDADDDAATGTVTRNGVAGFVYLEVLDASFSFDGVIGAFAITTDIVIIMLGLTIGAMFVRSLTVHLVRRGTLDQYVFLEHGAHYGIGALAVIMLLGITMHIPELVTGLIGVAFIGLSLVSSLRIRAKS